MQSYVNYLQGLYTALLSEVSEYDPILRRDSERDLSRLLSLVETRGLSFLMIDLPGVGKHFDRCLSTGRLIPSGIAGQRPFRKGGVIPRLFKGLLLRVFDEGGVLRDDPDVACIRFLRQLYYAAKKVKVQCSDSRTWEHVREFFQIDQEIRSPSLNWDEDEFSCDNLRALHIGERDACTAVPLLDGIHENGLSSRVESFSSDNPGILEAVQRTADIVSGELGRFEPSEWRTKHGPGAVADQRHTQFKYDFPNWPAKLDAVFPMDEFGFANSALWANFVSSDGVHKLFTAHEPPSKLIAVPKTLKGPRLIAAEPVAHQWCQQSIRDFLATRLSNTSISASIRFRDQGPNQRLAKAASHTQSHATIDLSSASDRLSCWVVERIFRANSSLLRGLHATRTRWVVNTIDRKSPKFHKLRKFACMGSACTFPVQSYVFAILAIAAVNYVQGRRPTIASIRSTSQEVQVYGDDIIVPVESMGVLQGLLEHLGLKVNRDKTFGIGKFRESCGVDAFDGHDVTPTYSMTYPDVSRPESIVSVVATHNNFAMRGYYVAAKYAKSTVMKLKRFVLAHVPMGSGEFGWYDHEWVGNSLLKKRWNPSLHRVEYRCDQVQTRSSRLPTGSDSSLLQYFTEARPVDFIQGDRIGVMKRAATSIRRRWVIASALDC